MFFNSGLAVGAQYQSAHGGTASGNVLFGFTVATISCNWWNINYKILNYGYLRANKN